jgi:hypothetical protein
MPGTVKRIRPAGYLNEKHPAGLHKFTETIPLEINYIKSIQMVRSFLKYFSPELLAQLTQNTENFD